VETEEEEEAKFGPFLTTTLRTLEKMPSSRSSSASRRTTNMHGIKPRGIHLQAKRKKLSLEY
jgi:hypothetical protein